MNLPVPVPGTDPGPDWATNVVADMYAIDAHNHSTGQGVPISPSGLNINDDLPLNGNNLTLTRSVRFSTQASPLSDATDIGCLYESGVDLYYNDGAGNQVRVTQGGSVVGSPGSITGLPSGTASASFAGATFTWQSATNTPAAMVMGPISIGRAAVSPKFVTISSSSSQVANYSLVTPAAAPVAGQYMVSDVSGNLSWSTAVIGQIPLGAVIGTFPNLAGAYVCTATTVADASGYVKCNGQTVSDVTSPMNGAVIPNINNTVFLAGSTTAGGTGGAATATLITANLPAHTHTAGSYATSVGVAGGTAVLTGTTTFAPAGHRHDMSHTHQWLTLNGSFANWAYSLASASSSATTITTGDALLFERNSSAETVGSGTGVWTNLPSGTQGYFTTGALSAPSGSGATALTGLPTSTASVGISSTGASLTGSNSVTGTSGAAGSGTAFSILPTYIKAVFVMRIK